MEMQNSDHSGIALVVLDVDGTLLRTGERLAPDTAEWVRQLHADGLQVALASARPLQSLRLLREEIGIQMPLVGFNGAVAEAADGTVIREVGLEISAPLATALAEFVAGGDSAVDAYTCDGRWLAFGQAARITREEDDTWMQADTRSDSLEPDELVGVRVTKVLCDGDDISSVERAIEGFDELNLSHSGNGLHDIWHQDSGKGNGVCALAEGLGLSLGQVLTVGDSDTDVPMLELVTVSIAVEPSSPAARAAATLHAHGPGSAELFETITKAVDRSRGRGPSA